MLVKKILKVFSVSIAVFLIAILIIAILPARTTKIKDENGKVIPNSIAEIKKIEIGGVNQYLMIRGNNKNNPVILFVHGGPGQSEIDILGSIKKNLKKNLLLFVGINEVLVYHHQKIYQKNQ